ncbi:conserved hypothetical protein [Methylocella silvestris BL2]|uniref:Uncharacterized protein n=1 Tax=Methylocella silvestris (strain DSM 15510 / CIP 108128 / LMG 27833 / NCIMB 13906 / BL2) TaxID=395965 RepID=B8ERJ1_METSB|nr:hypothetical protein [Methylocella silvestris]ACK51043.1 conserved hypothetical protein [Methylocella silvestris BL2]
MIIEYDFGKKERATEKRFAKSSAGEGQPRKIFGAAQVHLELANARIAKLEAALRDAKNACEKSGETKREQILVDAAEYARLLRCKELVAAALES